MSKKTTAKPESKLSQEFVRRTVTVPAEIVPFADKRTAAPEYAGNFSAYVRALIIRDREGQKAAA
jgi:hypothetical protein